ncbi:hypothetical protein EYF80_042030 [Liparis tanakae]|uniref:Uncharacterized protein n=1 Tax=Liparis tanakae TaxID=230148 RepID=A0A4Z2G2M3_9TELE|nr:hypothetical protein EYF80_042030 [Liparis tanakae]
MTEAAAITGGSATIYCAISSSTTSSTFFNAAEGRRGSFAVGRWFGLGTCKHCPPVVEAAPPPWGPTRNSLSPLLLSLSLSKLPLSFPSLVLVSPGTSAHGLVQPAKLRGMSLDLASPLQKPAIWASPWPSSSTQPLATSATQSAGSSHRGRRSTSGFPLTSIAIHTTQMQAESSSVRHSMPACARLCWRAPPA